VGQALTTNSHYFSCKRCGERLFDYSSVLHGSQSGPSPGSGNGASGNEASQCNEGVEDAKSALSRKEWLKLTWTSASAHAGTGCTSVFVRQPPEWAPCADGNGGRLTCPKCESKIGNYAWSGASCSCGNWVTPSFQFQLARVDRKGIVTLLPRTTST
jgi:hypothetical protein